MPPRRSDLELAVFDLDGTLVEAEVEYFIGEVRCLFLERGYPDYSAADILAGLSHHTLFDFLPEQERAEAAKLLWSCYDPRHIPPPRLRDGALQALEDAVARDMTVAIATARTTEIDHLREQLHPTGIMTHVTIISTWAGQRNWNDKKEQLRRLCASQAVDPAKAYMVGDSPDDIHSSVACGFGLRIALRSRLHVDRVLLAAKPCHLLDSISEVTPVIDHFLSKSE